MGYVHPPITSRFESIGKACKGGISCTPSGTPCNIRWRVYASEDPRSCVEDSFAIDCCKLTLRQNYRAKESWDDSRLSPFLTNILLPIPTALRSLTPRSSIPQGHSLSPFQSGSTAPLPAQLHFLSISVLESPQAAQISYSSETSLNFTFERRTYRFNIGRREGAAASVEARESYSIRYEGFPSEVVCA